MFSHFLYEQHPTDPWGGGGGGGGMRGESLNHVGNNESTLPYTLVSCKYIYIYIVLALSITVPLRVAVCSCVVSPSCW